MMASSSPIVTGENYTADDINYLRDDVLTGHTHDGTDGAVVPFNNLGVTGTGGSVRPAGGNVSYDEIEAHVASTQGAHGIDAGVYIVGSPTADTVILAGSDTLVAKTKNVSFGFTFGTTPKVVLTFKNSFPNPTNSGYHDALYTTNHSTTGFTANTPSDSMATASFDWIAVGTK